MSVEAYHVLGEAGVIPENTELLYGFVYTKMPKSPLHWFLLQRLFEMLRGLGLAGHVVRSEQPLSFADSEPEPDLAVIKGETDDFRLAHPQTAELVIEVCVTSHEYDRSKLRAYATGGVSECWLVLAPEKQIEIHSEPRDGVYTQVATHGPGGMLQSRVVPGLMVDLNAFFPN